MAAARTVGPAREHVADVDGDAARRRGHRRPALRLGDVARVGRALEAGLAEHAMMMSSPYDGVMAWRRDNVVI